MGEFVNAGFHLRQHTKSIKHALESVLGVTKKPVGENIVPVLFLWLLGFEARNAGRPGELHQPTVCFAKYQQAGRFSVKASKLLNLVEETHALLHGGRPCAFKHPDRKKIIFCHSIGSILSVQMGTSRRWLWCLAKIGMRRLPYEPVRINLDANAYSLSTFSAIQPESGSVPNTSRRARKR